MTDEATGIEENEILKIIWIYLSIVFFISIDKWE